MTMLGYIRSDKLKERLMVGSELDPEPCKGFRSALLAMVDSQEDADVEEQFIDDLAKRISDRVIHALEENYEIIPKKHAVRCKDCVHRHRTTCPFLIANAYKASSDDDFCSRGERRTDDVKNEELDITKIRVNIEEILQILHK